MGKIDNISNKEHLANLIRDAKANGWIDDNATYDPRFDVKNNYYDLNESDKKWYYRRIFQVPFLKARYGGKMMSTGIYDKNGKEILLPRWWYVSRKVHDMIMEQNDESVLAYMDREPTEKELKEKENEGAVRSVSVPKKNGKKKSD